MLLVDLVSSELTLDLEWREAELAIMRKQIYTAPPGSVVETAMLRAGVAMLYAHYEGFCKFALEIYVDSLDKLKLKRRELSWELAAFSMKKFHADLLGQKSPSRFFSLLFARINDELEDAAEYERPPQIANLWPDLLIDWLTRLGLSSLNAVENHTVLESLVENRNQIAHGRKLVIKTRDELDRYSKAALLAMHEIAVEVVSALQRQQYLSSGNARTVINHAV